MRRNLQREAIARALYEKTEKGRTAPKVDKMPEFKEGDEWRCRQCGKDKFAEFIGGVLVIVYRERKVSITAADARYETRCRRCGTLNVLNVTGLEIKLVEYRAPDATKKAAEIAHAAGVSLDDIPGTGQAGRILVADVENYLAIAIEHKPGQRVVRREGEEKQVKELPRPRRPPPGIAGDAVDTDEQG